eukprot:2060133-Prymnesium_polylepis.1
MTFCSWHMYRLGTWAADSLCMIRSLMLVLTCLASIRCVRWGWRDCRTMSDGVREIVGPIIGFVGLSDAFPDMDEHSSAE